MQVQLAVTCGINNASVFQLTLQFGSLQVFQVSSQCSARDKFKSSCTLNCGQVAHVDFLAEENKGLALNFELMHFLAVAAQLVMSWR